MCVDEFIAPIKKVFVVWIFKKKSNKTWIFESLDSNYESVHKKDVVELDKAEAIDAIESLNVEEIGSARALISFVREYVDWCKKEHVFTNIPGGFSLITVDDIDFGKVLGKILFKDDIDLIESIKEVRTLDDGYSDVAILALSWIGLTREEISAL